MIIRIVKMSFRPEAVEEFLGNFENNKSRIRQFEGCHHLELLQESGNEHVFFTYSWWENEQSLENYRNSQLFKQVWSKTKILFSDKPQAWSLVQKVKL